MYKSMFLLICTGCLVFAAAGCSTTSSDNGIHMAIAVAIKYINGKGENLLNPDHPHAITEQNTNLYYLVNGKKKKIYKGRLEYPKMFMIRKHPDGEYLMTLFANTPRDQNTAITYIDFKDYPTDTLKVQYISNKYGIDVTKAWYNGKLRWNKAKMHTNKLSKIVIVVTKHLSEK